MRLRIRRLPTLLGYISVWCVEMACPEFERHSSATACQRYLDAGYHNGLLLLHALEFYRQNHHNLNDVFNVNPKAEQLRCSSCKSVRKCFLLRVNCNKRKHVVLRRCQGVARTSLKACQLRRQYKTTQVTQHNGNPRQSHDWSTLTAIVHDFFGTITIKWQTHVHVAVAFTFGLQYVAKQRKIITNIFIRSNSPDICSYRHHPQLKASCEHVSHPMHVSEKQLRTKEFVAGVKTVSKCELTCDLRHILQVVYCSIHRARICRNSSQNTM